MKQLLTQHMSIKTADESELSLANLGVMLNSELSMKQHIAKVTFTYLLLPATLLRQVRLLVRQEITAQLVHAFVLSIVDYGNSVLAVFQSRLLRRYNESRRCRSTPT